MKWIYFVTANNRVSIQGPDWNGLSFHGENFIIRYNFIIIFINPLFRHFHNRSAPPYEEGLQRLKIQLNNGTEAGPCSMLFYSHS